MLKLSPLLSSNKKDQITENQNFSFTGQNNSSEVTPAPVTTTTEAGFHDRFALCINCQPFSANTSHFSFKIDKTSINEKIEVCKAKTFRIDRRRIHFMGIIHRRSVCDMAMNSTYKSEGNTFINCDNYQVCAIKFNMSEKYPLDAWRTSESIFCHVDKLKIKESKTDYPEIPEKLMCPSEAEAILIGFEERYTRCENINNLCIICATNDFEFFVCSSEKCFRKSSFSDEYVLVSACQVVGEITNVQPCFKKLIPSQFCGIKLNSDNNSISNITMESLIPCNQDLSATIFDLKMIITLSVCCTVIVSLSIINVCLVVKLRQMAFKLIKNQVKNSIENEASTNVVDEAYVVEEANNEPYDFLEMYQIYDELLLDSTQDPGPQMIPKDHPKAL